MTPFQRKTAKTLVHLAVSTAALLTLASTAEAAAYQFQVSYPGITASAPVVAPTQSSAATASLFSPTFSSTAVGSSYIATATLTNTGTSALTLTVPTTASVTGSAAFSFKDTTCLLTLPSTAGSNTCTMRITFSPTTVGTPTGSLSIPTAAGAQTVLLSATATAAVADSSYASVTLLAGFDSSLVDDKSGAVITNAGVTLSNSPVKFGAQSAQFAAASNSVLSLPYTKASYDWYGTDYTLEAWVYASSWSNWSYSAGPASMIGNADPAGTSNYWSFGPMNDGTVKFYYWNGAQNVVQTSATLPLNQWNHIALVHTGTSIKIFINGLSSATGTVNGTPLSFGGATTQNLIVGRISNTSITGYIDELRITKGVARYPGNFTPSATAYPRQ